ncbi:sulfite oxidase [Halobacteriales archaeon QS_3_64_16]|nr:MAG: sulfite oxidase [Halobacteriales archaeon QS_3_64_16]
MSRLQRVSLPPRFVDWSIFLLLAIELASGLVSLTTGQPGGQVVFVLHSVVGLALCVLVFEKLRRVRKRVSRPDAWDRATPVSVLLAVVTLGALGSGIAWVLGGSLALGPWGLLNLHIGLGLLLVLVVVVHLYHRWRPPQRSDFEERRTVLSYLLLIGVGALIWRFQTALNDLLNTAGAEHRFTGSREEGTDAGNEFPVTSWVADDPDPIAIEDWELTVTGEVGRTLLFDYDEIAAEGIGGGEVGDRRNESEGSSDDGRLRATLDCTSGWYSVHDWRGVRVGDLLEATGTAESAQWISFRSVTGYRWSLPIEEAREALLATHVGGERLTHGHGFPLRLVAPGRRGFQWVKWVTEIEVRERKDPGQWLAVFVSGFDGGNRQDSNG